eukprot:1254831-Rhodomonas_salina.1
MLVPCTRCALSSPDTSSCLQVQSGEEYGEKGMMRVTVACELEAAYPPWSDAFAVRCPGLTSVLPLTGVGRGAEKNSDECDSTQRRLGSGGRGLGVDLLSEG